tara:strand:+ start:606 stop:914 length:309 start_codon:yes stop_codon:yes gene_type:complete
MSKFEEREKSFEKKFAKDEETLFKINAKRNKYLGEWAADKLQKDNKSEYVKEVIKSDFLEPGDEDVFNKIKKDFQEASIEIADVEIREKMKIFMESAKKDFI